MKYTLPISDRMLHCSYLYDLYNRLLLSCHLTPNFFPTNPWISTVIMRPPSLNLSQHSPSAIAFHDSLAVEKGPRPAVPILALWWSVSTGKQLLLCSALCCYHGLPILCVCIFTLMHVYLFLHAYLWSCPLLLYKLYWQNFCYIFLNNYHPWMSQLLNVFKVQSGSLISIQVTWFSLSVDTTVCPENASQAIPGTQLTSPTMSTMAPITAG